MSDPKPKKQFKSQSVNSLFRQQAASIKSTEKLDTKKTKAPAQGATKLKLVVKRKVVSKKSTRSLTPLSTSSTDTSTNETTTDKEQPFTSATPEPLSEAAKQPETPSDPTPFTLPKAEDDEWSDIQSQISSHANSPQLPPTTTKFRPQLYSPESSRSWSSPNSKISSFRRSIAMPMIHSLSQSPLSKPADGVGMFNGIRAVEQRAQSVAVEEAQWKSPTIWNEDRHLSTKSDSALSGSWAPFDIEKLSLDDAYRVQPQTIDTSQSRSGSQTSRFFPSPVVEQNPSFDQFPRQPSFVERTPSAFQAPPQFNLFPSVAPPPLTPLSMQQPQPTPPLPPPGFDYGFQGRQLFNEEEPLELNTSSQALDSEVYPEHFHTDLTQIPISLPETGDRDTLHTYHRRPVSYEQQAYPEGFSSTFYKRGSNNFMFIRELQPKLVTGKNRDSVEVRVSFPSTVEEADEDEAIKMRCHIVNVDVRDLEGRIAGIKVSKAQNSTRGSRGKGRSRGFARR